MRKSAEALKQLFNSCSQVAQLENGKNETLFLCKASDTDAYLFAKKDGVLTEYAPIKALYCVYSNDFMGYSFLAMYFHNAMDLLYYTRDARRQVWLI